LKEEPLSLDELQLFRRRDLLIKTALAVPFSGILWRLWDLQIKEGEKYKQLSLGNRIRLLGVAAPRGIIYDERGVILSKNIPSYNLMLVREDTKDIPGTLAKISATLNIPVSIMEQALASRKKESKYTPIMIYKDLTWHQMALISSYQEEFVGVSIEVSPRRSFPYPETFAHVIGYMNQINKNQVKDVPDNKLMSARVIGQDGMEKIYNEVLIGIDGGEQVEVDSGGRTIQRMDSIEPVPGHDLRLNLNAKLQKKIEQVMGDHTGSAIVMDPHTGAVKAMLSLPGYDANLFSQGLSTEMWNELINDPDHVLHNKCIQGIYSPGSTFKMLVAAAALEAGLIDENTEHVCEGVFRVGNVQAHCWNRSGHGRLNVYGAIENSCNVFFYKVGKELGVDKIHEMATRLGLGSLTGVDLLHEKSGLVPSREWKQKRFNEPWYPGETLPVSIGQGFLSVTPIQLLSYINVIANGGYLVKPQIAANIYDKESPRVFTPVRTKVEISEKTLQIVQKAMFRNVNGAHGTGHSARSDFYKVAGKTGTTQVVSHKTRTRLRAEGGGEEDEKFFNHAWFVGYAPFDNPKISAVLLLENGQSGNNAAKLMKDIMQFYFSTIDPMPGLTPEPFELPIDPA